VEEICVVSTTVGGRPAADTLAESAVTSRLAACAQVTGPVTSTYWWQGRVETEQEWMVLFKTRADRAQALVEHLRATHPYDVPEVLVTPVTGGNPAYLAWVAEEAAAGPPARSPPPARGMIRDLFGRVAGVSCPPVPDHPDLGAAGQAFRIWYTESGASITSPAAGAVTDTVTPKSL
jgi:periplasmic divalent cation tolerance protein